MALELIVNVVLLLASLFCFWYVGATMPQSRPSELGAEQWPQLLLILLIIAIAYNIFSFFRRNALKDIAASFKDFIPSILRLVKSKLFIGMVLLVILGILYEWLGFLATCLIFMSSYGYLLGARKIGPLLISSLVITFILYIVFAVLLSVLLPRGYVPFLRSITYFLEGIATSIQRLW